MGSVKTYNIRSQVPGRKTVEMCAKQPWDYLFWIRWTWQCENIQHGYRIIQSTSVIRAVSKLPISPAVCSVNLCKRELRSSMSICGSISWMTNFIFWYWNLILSSDDAKHAYRDNMSWWMVIDMDAGTLTRLTLISYIIFDVLLLYLGWGGFCKSSIAIIELKNSS